MFSRIAPFPRSRERRTRIEREIIAPPSDRDLSRGSGGNLRDAARTFAPRKKDRGRRRRPYGSIAFGAGGRERGPPSAFFPPRGVEDHLCLSGAPARAAFYFTFFVVPLNTPRRTAIARIQVRRSTYVRLGFRRPPRAHTPPPAARARLRRLPPRARSAHPVSHFRCRVGLDPARNL